MQAPIRAASTLHAVTLNISRPYSLHALKMHGNIDVSMLHIHDSIPREVVRLSNKKGPPYA